MRDKYKYRLRTTNTSDLFYYSIFNNERNKDVWQSDTYSDVEECVWDAAYHAQALNDDVEEKLEVRFE